MEFKTWPDPKDVRLEGHKGFAGRMRGSKWLVIVDAKSNFSFVAGVGKKHNCKKSTATSNKKLLSVIGWSGAPIFAKN